MAITTRQTWMDVVRGACILLVLFLHAFSLIKDQPGTETIEAFNLVFTPYRMTILMFLSGLLLHRSFGRDTRGYIIGKFAMIFWPFLLWSLIVLAAEQRFTLEYVLKIPISSPTLLWYLWFLFAYYMIALVLRKYKIDFLAVAAVALVASVFLPDFLRISRFAYLLFFFLLGATVIERDIRVSGRGVFAILMATVILGSALSVYGLRINYNALYSWAPISLALLLYSLPRSVYSFPGNTSLQWVGRNSLVFYVVHFPIQVIFARYYSSMFDDRIVLFYFSIFFVSFAVAAILVLLRQNLSPVAVLFDFTRLSILPGMKRRDGSRAS